MKPPEVAEYHNNVARGYCRKTVVSLLPQSHNIMTSFGCQTSQLLRTNRDTEKLFSSPGRRIHISLNQRNLDAVTFGSPAQEPHIAHPSSHISVHSRSPDCIRYCQRAYTNKAMAMAYTASSQFSPELARTESYSKDSSSPEPPGFESQPRDSRGPHRRGYQACQRCRERKVKCDLGSMSHLVFPWPIFM